MKWRNIREMFSLNQNNELKQLIEKAKRSDAKENSFSTYINPRKMYIHPQPKNFINLITEGLEYSPV
jgi:hypothetical protein